MASSDPVLSVLKALDILRFVSEADRPPEPGDIARAMGMKITTCYNLLRSLALRGYVARCPEGGYITGPAPEELVRNGRRRTLFRSGAALLRKLSAEFPDAVLTFSELTPSAVCCRLRISPDRPGELQHPMDQFFQPYSSVSAICLQAMAENGALFESNFPFEEYGGKWYRSLRDFRKEQREIRKNGYFVRLLEPDGITAAFYLGDGCAIGFRDVSMEENVISRIRQMLAGKGCDS